MEIQIQTIHFDADNKLKELIKLELRKLYSVYTRIESVNTILRIDKNSKNKNKVVEILLNVPGDRLFTSDQAESFEAAFGLASTEIKKQLIQHKEKMKIWM
jgi:putative sigma-54 modulation protein